MDQGHSGSASRRARRRDLCDTVGMRSIANIVTAARTFAPVAIAASFCAAQPTPRVLIIGVDGLGAPALEAANATQFRSWVCSSNSLPLPDTTFDPRMQNYGLARRIDVCRRKSEPMLEAFLSTGFPAAQPWLCK